jgi:hypothetical protein
MKEEKELGKMKNAENNLHWQFTIQFFRGTDS